jgi:hypothetical protein
MWCAMQALTTQPVLEVIMAESNLTAQRLRELLNYDADTGLFTWRVTIGCGHRREQVKRRAGDNAGYVNADGYVMIGIEGREYRAHRLAWLYMKGEWPASLLDHKNREKADNRWDNLREADKSVNSQNVLGARSSNRTGLQGVSYQANGYFARIRLNGAVTYLGRFKSADEAHQAYLTAKRRLHEGCTI